MNTPDNGFSWQANSDLLQEELYSLRLKYNQLLGEVQSLFAFMERNSTEKEEFLFHVVKNEVEHIVEEYS